MNNVRHDVQQVVRHTLTEAEIDVIIKEIQAEDEAEQSKAASTTADI